MINPEKYDDIVPSKKLVQLLAAFSPPELQALNRFLRSPYFVGQAVYGQLFGLIQQALEQTNHHTEATLKQLDKEYVWRALFGEQVFNDLVLRRHCSNLGAYALDAISLLHHDPLQWELTQLAWLSTHDLPLHFQQHDHKFEQVFEAQSITEPSPHASDYLARFRLASIRHQYAERANDPALDMQALKEADYYLECFYASQKLRHLCDAMGYKHLKAQSFQIESAPQWLEGLAQSPLLHEPLIGLYWLAAHMWQSPEDESRFDALKQSLRSRLADLRPADRKNLFVHACNYCIDTKINSGRIDYFQQLFELYQLGLSSGALLTTGSLQHQDYKNIVTVGLHVKAFDWVEQFIREYTSQLPAEEQSIALSYNLAKVYFSKGQYQQVIEQLQEIDYPNVVYALGARLLLLKTYFELDEIQPLDSLIDSFRIYLQRNKVISGEIKKQYLNVLRFVKKLSRLAPYDDAGRQKVRTQVAACRALPDKQWILDKLGPAH